MAGSVELRLPPWPEWGFVARTVVLSVANTAGASLSSLDEVDRACGHVWDEVVGTAGVRETSIEATLGRGALHLVVVGRGLDLLPDTGGWASPVFAAMMSRSARTVFIDRSTEHVRIDVELALSDN
jgi:hypothetical protein